MARSRSRWTGVTGRIYVYADDAERRKKELEARFPEHEFRVWGHALSGFEVQAKEKS